MLGKTEKEGTKKKKKGRNSLFVYIVAREFKIYGVLIMIVLITYQDINDFIYLLDRKSVV